MMRPAFVVMLMVCTLLAPARSSAAPASKLLVLRTVLEADSLLTTPANAARDRAIGEWARRASLGDLVWLLRRSATELGSAEPLVLDAALAACAPTRTQLRERLLARRARVAPAKPARKGERALPSLARLRPEASVYRVAVITPDEGEYGAIGPVLRAAILDGLNAQRGAAARTFVLDSAGTGDSDPARVSDALDSLVQRADVIVGELLSPPTIALATAARVAGATLLSPTATDERIGRIGRTTFQLGPSGALRGQRLAARMCEGNPPPVVAVVSTRAGAASPFTSAFIAEASTRTGHAITPSVLPSDPAAVVALARALKNSGASVLMCDASSRELEPLVRALASEGAALRLCGGTALAPEGFRANARALLEGVTYIDDGWRLAAPERARLDSLATLTGTRAGTVWTRGWLLGRAIARAVEGGACSADELAMAMRASDAWLADRGFLDLSADGARLPFYTVHNGRAIALSETQ